MMRGRPVPPGGFRLTPPASTPPVTPLITTQHDLARMHAMASERGLDHAKLKALIADKTDYVGSLKDVPLGIVKLACAALLTMSPPPFRRPTPAPVASTPP